MIMEKIINRGIIVLVVILLFFVFNKFRTASISHHDNISKIEQNNTSAKVKDLLNEYMLTHLEYPATIDEVVDISGDAIKKDGLSAWHDPFSADSSLYSYLPLYDRMNKKRLGFVLLSAGVDGKVDLINTEGDSLFIDDFENKIAVYNPSGIKKHKKSKDQHIDVKVGFSLFDKMTGKKDLIVGYGIARDYLEENASKIRTLDILSNSTFEDVRVDDVFLINISDEYGLSFNSDTLIKRNKDYTAYIQVIDHLSDTITIKNLVGRYHRFDSATKCVFFVQALLID
jgi:hypothetical protein